MSPATISADDARRACLRAQGLLGPRITSPRKLLGLIGAIQIDSISVLARSHLLVAWSRVGPVPRGKVESALWSSPTPVSFEYWSHAACILPIARWPEFAFRRRARRDRGFRWHRLEDPVHACAEIRSRLASEGPLTATELGGAKGGGPWWDWTDTKIAVEWLLDTGEVVCSIRRGFKRVYDLAERVVPSRLFVDDLDDRTCHRILVEEAGRALGIATIAELAHHHMMTLAEVRSVIYDSNLVPVAIDGLDAPTFANQEALDALGSPGRTRPVLLSPFDSLIWDRRRTQRLFGFTHKLEAYTPREQRVHGYFAMPVLANGKIVARVDPRREGSTLVALRTTLHSKAAVRPVASALNDAANWVRASSVRVEQVVPANLEADLRDAVRATSLD